MFKTFLTALTLQIKQYNLRLWDPFYIKGGKGGPAGRKFSIGSSISI